MRNGLNFPRWSGVILGYSLALCSLSAHAGAPEAGYARLIIKPRAQIEAREKANEKLTEKLQELEARLPGMGKALARIPAASGLEVEKDLPGIGVALARVPERVADKMKEVLARNPYIEFVEADRPLSLADTVANDTYYSKAWHLDKINAPLAWDYSLGEQVTVAVLDTGINANHVDLKGKVLSGWNTVSNNTNSADVNGHGTEVAGVVAAVSNNATGVTSIAWKTKILPVRVSNQSNGVAYLSDIAEGLVWAADHGADVANISYDISASQTIRDAAKYMQDHNGVVVAAAGNSGSLNSYADNPYVISVSATSSSDTLTSWSSYGDYVDVAAPGAGIYTTTRDGGYARVSGTSFSSPLTAGVLALMRAANPQLVPEDLELALEGSALDLGVAGYDTHYGNGRIDAVGAVMAVQAPADTTPPTLAIVSPSEGDNVTGKVTIKTRISDDVGVTRVAFFVNGIRIGVDKAAPYEVEWDSNAVAQGAAELMVRAYDAAGNMSMQRIELTVSRDQLQDVEPPRLRVYSPGDGSTLSGMVGIGVWSYDLSGDNSQAVKVQTQILVDGISLCQGNDYVTQCPWDTGSVQRGWHDIVGKATDAAGNQSTSRISVYVE